MKIQLQKRTRLLDLVKIVRESLDEKQTKTINSLQGKFFGEPAKATSVAIEDIWVPDYQRDLYISSIIKHLVSVGGFDWRLFQVGTFAKNGNEFDAGDCMHRLVKLLLLNPEIRYVPGHIVDYTYEEAAIHFNRVNGALTKDLTAPEKFQSRVKGKIEEDVKLAKFLQKCNLSCGRVNNDKAKRSVAFPTLEKVYSWPKAETIVPWISELLYKGFGDKFSNQSFAGLCQLATFDSKKYGSYVAMFENDNLSRKLFEEWFLDNAKVNWTHPDNMIDKVEKLATNNWDISIAYTIMRKFLAKNRRCKWQLQPIATYYNILKGEQTIRKAA